MYIRSDRPVEQIVEVVRRLDLRNSIKAFTRCLRCNGRLERVDKAEVLGELEPLTRRFYEDFRRCPHCRRIYWAGTHYERLSRLLDEILAQLDQVPSAQVPESGSGATHSAHRTAGAQIEQQHAQ